MTPHRILIAGCGYLGTHLGRAFLAQGASVKGIRRSVEAAKELREAGIEPHLADLTDPATLTRLPECDLIVFSQAPGRNDDYERTYLESTQNVVNALKRFSEILFVSSGSVYSTRDGAWVDETTDPRVPGHPSDDAGKRAGVLLDAEKAVLLSGHPAYVVRSAGIYGPGRNRLKPILSGSFSPELSDDYTNRIRVEDLVTAIVSVLRYGKRGEIYLAADDQPTTQREFYEWLYDELKRPLPVGGTDSVKRHGGNKRCRNGKLRSLGWAPRYPSYKEGYADLLAAVA